MSYKRWTFLQLDKEAAGEMSQQSGFDPVLCLLLTGRGITDVEQATQFLSGSDWNTDPYLFADMDAAVDRIQAAMDNGESIAIYGDYDADGITATVLLYSYLREKGARVFYRLPHRQGEGYGLHRSTVEEMAAQGVNLIITVDNGISAIEEVDYANSLGIDVVITDHHQPPETLPAAVAVVNPHRADCPSTFKDFAGVGVAFWLACALEGDVDVIAKQYADLAALGTLADVMPLCDDNRLIVRQGLTQISRSPRIGMRALREVAGTLTRPQTASTVAFTIAPRINAAGRMDIPETAAQLLLCDDADEATVLAEKINQLNQSRQSTEAAILEQIVTELEQNPARLSQRVLVVSGEGWHQGVLGILAARLLECYGKPTIVLNAENGIAHGSGRSVAGFSLYEALCACDHCLLGFGGHEQAAGLTLEAARIDEFITAVNRYAAEQFPVMPVPELSLDCRLRPSQITVELLNCLSALEPFGSGNPQPLFGLFGMQLERVDAVGGGKHVKLTLCRDGVRITAMKFSTTPETLGFAVGDTVNLAVSLDKNEYQGKVSVSVIVKDMRYADQLQETHFKALSIYESVLRREQITDMPTRDQLALVYRFIKQSPFIGSIERLSHILCGDSLSVTALYLCLQILCEAQVITFKQRGNTVDVSVCEITEKAELSATPTAVFLQTRGT